MLHLVSCSRAYCAVKGLLFLVVETVWLRYIFFSSLTFVQDGIGGFITGDRLLRQMLVRFSQTLELGKPCIEGHRGVTGILCKVEIRRSPQLLLNHQRLLQELEASCQKLVLDLQEVTLTLVGLKRNGGEIRGGLRQQTEKNRGGEEEIRGGL